jgi:hypothetical protein
MNAISNIYRFVAIKDENSFTNIIPETRRLANMKNTKYKIRMKLNFMIGGK